MANITCLEAVTTNLQHHANCSAHVGREKEELSKRGERERERVPSQWPWQSQSLYSLSLSDCVCEANKTTSRTLAKRRANDCWGEAAQQRVTLSYPHLIPSPRLTINFQCHVHEGSLRRTWTPRMLWTQSVTNSWTAVAVAAINKWLKLYPRSEKWEGRLLLILLMWNAKKKKLTTLRFALAAVAAAANEKTLIINLLIN